MATDVEDETERVGGGGGGSGFNQYYIFNLPKNFFFMYLNFKKIFL
jgi:hypothetical protein